MLKSIFKAFPDMLLFLKRNGKSSLYTVIPPGRKFCLNFECEKGRGGGAILYRRPAYPTGDLVLFDPCFYATFHKFSLLDYVILLHETILGNDIKRPG